MPVCRIKQAEVYASNVHDDNLDTLNAPSALTLEEDLNYIRSVLKQLGGGNYWYDPDIDESLGQLLDDFQVEHYTYSEDPAKAGQHKHIHAEDITTANTLQFWDNPNEGWIAYGDSDNFYISARIGGSTTHKPAIRLYKEHFIAFYNNEHDASSDNTYADFYFYKSDPTNSLPLYLKFQTSSYFNHVMRVDSGGFFFRNYNDSAYVPVSTGNLQAYGRVDVLSSPPNGLRIVGGNINPMPGGVERSDWGFSFVLVDPRKRALFGTYDSSGLYDFELYKDQGTSELPIRLRFHQSNTWWKTLKVQNSGFHFRSGDDTEYADIFARNATFSGGLSVGGSFSPGTVVSFLPAEYNAIGLMYNLLINANLKGWVTVSGSIATDVTSDIGKLFDGRGITLTTTNGIDPADPLIITIDVPDVHTQTRKAVFGWISRYWYPTDFTVEYYDYNAGSWVTVYNTTSYDKPYFGVDLDHKYVGSLRITIRSTVDSSNRLQLSEIFFLHPEAADAFSGAYDFNVGHEILFPDNAAADNITRAFAVGANKSQKLGFVWGYASDYGFKIGTGNVERVRILSNGNIGIWKTTPAYPLDVNGTINSKGIRVVDEVGAHIETDGSFYRYSGQVYITVDDYLYIRDRGATSVAVTFDTNNKKITTAQIRAYSWMSSEAYYVTEGGNNKLVIASATDGRIYMAPYDDGAWQWGREFGYRPDNNRWYAETEFEAVAFYETSSRELKEKIREYKESAIELINKLKVVTYRFKGNKTKKEHIGLIAEDTPKELTDVEGKHLDTGSILGVLIKAVQELYEKISSLEEKVATNA